jgi:hypothetical protein
MLPQRLRSPLRPLLVACAALLATLPAPADASCDESQPEWLMCEDFEGAPAGWEAWFDASGFVECRGCSEGLNDPDRLVLSDDPDHVFDGDYALHMPAAAGADYQGAELIFRSCTDEGRTGCDLTNHERLYLRTRVKLAPDHEYVHHFLSIGGTRPNAYWEGSGNAGCRPNGYRHAGTTVDFDRGRRLFFYTYFPDMRCDSGGYCSGSYAADICDGCATKDMPCDSGPECCWGNHFEPEPQVHMPRGEWVCLEMMMAINTPGVADGEMAFWVNDTLAHQVTDMHWRDEDALGLNRANLSHYIARSDAERPNRISFDDFVVSTERIGCDMTPGPGVDGGPAPATDGGPAPAGDDGGSSVDDGGGEGTDDDGSAASTTGGCSVTDGGASNVFALLCLSGLLLWVRRRRLAELAFVLSIALVGCAEDGAPEDGAPEDGGPEDGGAGPEDGGAGPDRDAASPTADAGSGADAALDAGVEPSDFEPYFAEGFESYADGESLSGPVFDAAGRTTASDAQAARGARSARMAIDAGDGGGFGQWGGIVRIDPVLRAGEEVWVRLDVYWPSDFTFSASPWMKFLRLHSRFADGSNGGYNDLYIDEADSTTSVLRTIKEIHDRWEVYDGDPIPRDRWERYEMYLSIDDVPAEDGGAGRVRIWRDGELIFDRADVPTIPDADGDIDAFFLFTYWNNEMPPNNHCFVDDLVIATSASPPPNTDAAGHRIIGDWTGP